MIHQLKSWPIHFQPIIDGIKLFEVRHNDRNFQDGDILHLNEFNPCGYCQGVGQVTIVNLFTNATKVCERCDGAGGQFTGRETRHKISVVFRDQPGVSAHYVVMSFAQ